jgi:DNA helicase-2/ATP-dependent DNA helicase PcrA
VACSGDQAGKSWPVFVPACPRRSVVQVVTVADEVVRQREDGVVPKCQTVLFRTSHHSDALELELARRGATSRSSSSAG